MCTRNVVRPYYPTNKFFESLFLPYQWATTLTRSTKQLNCPFEFKFFLWSK